MRAVLKNAVLWWIGGLLYCLLEVLFRSRTHWSMMIVGGVCFLLCGMINEYYPWDMPMLEQMTLSAIVITSIEFCSGIVLNLWCKLNVWDYSNIPMNLFGQICAPFAAAWFILSGAAIVLDDYLRYWLFEEEKPQYQWRGKWILPKKN